MERGTAHLSSSGRHVGGSILAAPTRVGRGLPPLGEQPTVSVVVCAYADERLESLVALAEAMPLQTYQPEDVIVVVDGNEPLAATVRARLPDVRVLENPGPHGHAAAANRGLSAARGDVVAFIDDDAAPDDERWLEWLVYGYRQPSVLGVGGSIEPTWLTRRPAWFPDEFLWVVGGSHRGLPPYGGIVRNLWMGNMSIRRSVFDEVGCFRMSLSRVGKKPFGAQETELCIRASQRWPEGVFLHEPRARVRHRVPEPRTTFAYFRSHCFDEAVAKVSMSRHVGARDGLAAERAYLARILPAGVAHGIGDAVLRGDPSGLGRAAAILAGAGAAGCGYVRARLRPEPVASDEELGIADRSTPGGAPKGSAPDERRARRLDGSVPGPILLHEVELGEPLPALPSRSSETGASYGRALSLVRLHTYPLGLAEIPLRGENLSPADYAAGIWSSLRSEIAVHLDADGLPVPERLTGQGLPTIASPPCQEARRRLLADAPRVSVVIPTRDGGERLGPCLRSLLACAYPGERYEIIVVDNVPRTSATFDFLRAAYGERVRYVRSDRPGSASARNRGLAAANGDIVAFIDDDVLIDRHWLAELAKGFTLAPGVGCVTQLVLPLELETPAQLWFEEYGGASKGFVRCIYDLEDHRPDDPLFPFNAGRFGSGGSMAFDRAVLERLGGFDPALGNGTPALGGVDIEAFFRTIVEGYALVYEPAAIIRHRHVREYAVLRDRIYAYGVGLTAFILRSLAAKPSLLPPLLLKLPRGLAFALAPSSSKHAAKSSSYPAELRRAELTGMLHGPVAYARSVRRFGPPTRVRGGP